ncbi:substrate-binding periplasmic protein [Teredinibacter waterburyi]|uniref:substrate-binding periplasmic protein n=1 Tax=Teredinibacter waterburyi TaxID=1500538 RepID=UPI00165FFB68|nr:transporter substrate-binding domain-containing protein [Teredinibacter waterburyi]
MADIATFFIALLGFFSAGPLSAESIPAPEVLRLTLPPIEASSTGHAQYYPQLLDLALEKTRKTHGDFELRFYPKILSSARLFKELEKRDGLVDLLWNMSSDDRESRVRAIEIPLLKNLNSYKVFLVQAENRDILKHVKSMDDLAKFRAGLGTSWPDADVFRRNKLPVVNTSNYELLFAMLTSKRFDYFPRGLHEVWGEVALHTDQDIVVEPYVMLHYPAPYYFFVRKNNTALAERIELGLMRAIEDGSFDRLFMSIPSFKRGVEELERSGRRVIELR